MCWTRRKFWIRACKPLNDGHGAWPSAETRLSYSAIHVQPDMTPSPSSTMKPYLALAMLPLLLACATDPSSHAELRGEVDAHARNGMQKTALAETLTTRGFTCSAEGTSLSPKAKGIAECTRSRGSVLPPYGCVHRVHFNFDENTGLVSNLDVWRPACAGL